MKPDFLLFSTIFVCLSYWSIIAGNRTDWILTTFSLKLSFLYNWFGGLIGWSMCRRRLIADVKSSLNSQIPEELKADLVNRIWEISKKKYSWTITKIRKPLLGSLTLSSVLIFIIGLTHPVGVTQRADRDSFPVRVKWSEFFLSYYCYIFGRE